MSWEQMKGIKHLLKVPCVVWQMEDWGVGGGSGGSVSSPPLLYLLSELVSKHFFFSCCSFYPTTHPGTLAQPSASFFFLHGEEQESHVPKDGARALGPHLQLEPCRTGLRDLPRL